MNNLKAFARERGGVRRDRAGRLVTADGEFILVRRKCNICNQKGQVHWDAKSRWTHDQGEICCGREFYAHPAELLDVVEAVVAHQRGATIAFLREIARAYRSARDVTL